MKKILSFAFVGAIVLAGATMVSCSSDDSVAENNPTFDGTTVKTQFSINIPNTLKTRMTAGDAQESETFSGMKNIWLYAFNTSADVANGDEVVIAPIKLSDFTQFDQTAVNAKIYNDVAVPVGVNHFIFYGEKTTTVDGQLDATYGAAGDVIENTVNFNLKNITDATVADVASQSGAQDVLDALDAVSAAFTTQIAAATTAGHSSAGLLTDLQTLFNKNKAGSAASVNALFADLRTELAKISGDYAAAVSTATVDVTTTFPATIKLPDGAVGVQHDSTTDKWAFAATNTNGLGQPELNTYVKPASLYYTINTPIKTSEETEYANKWNNTGTYTTWEAVLALYSGTQVASTTRSIVLQKEIQYAVAQLVSQIRVKEGVTELKANDGTGKDDVVTIVPTATDLTKLFKVSAILVGDQKNADWKFQPTGDGTFVVYDPTQTGSTTDFGIGSGLTSENYTLLIESASSGNTDVNIAVELINNTGVDFYGYNDELIPAGAKFYLVGVLKVSEGTQPTGQTLTSVFKQDYKTTVTFSINEESLKNAYNTIPDLRTPQLELGLSVDLKWKAGLTFNVVL